VRDIHEGRPAKRIGALYRRAAARFLPLFLASLVYVICVLIGLILLLVPGLYVFAR
jgi:hypothetical protein